MKETLVARKASPQILLCGCKIQTNRALQTVFVIFNCSVTSPQCQHNSQIINNINFQNCFLYFDKTWILITRVKKRQFSNLDLILLEATFFMKHKLWAAGKYKITWVPPKWLLFLRDHARCYPVHRTPAVTFLNIAKYFLVCTNVNTAEHSALLVTSPRSGVYCAIIITLQLQWWNILNWEQTVHYPLPARLMMIKMTRL